METPIVKPGVKTTEFWLTLVLALVGPLTVLAQALGFQGVEGVGEQVTESAPAIADSIDVVIANIVSLGAAWRYISARENVKKAINS